MAPPWVVKIGGSLEYSPALSYWLQVIAAEGTGKVVVVPGGGAFADGVRRAQKYWGFDDAAAHHMAILAMQQYGVMLTGLCAELQPADSPEAAQAVLAAGGVAVWLPRPDLLNAAGIPCGWDITSDSLAAWLAGTLGARRLVLVKSAPLPDGPYDCQVLAADGVVDGAFFAYARAGGYGTVVCGCEDYRLLSLALRRGDTPADRLIRLEYPGDSS